MPDSTISSFLIQTRVLLLWLILIGLSSLSQASGTLPVYIELTETQSTEESVLELPAELTALLRSKEAETVSLDGPLGPPTIIVHEGFESSFPTGLWSANPGAEGCVWGKNTPNADVGSYSASPVASGCSWLPPTNYPNNMATYMFYGPFDLSEAKTACLNFRYAAELGAGGDVLRYGGSADGVTFTAAQKFGGDFSWESASWLLDRYSGDSSVWVIFGMVSDNISNVARGVLIDEVVVQISDTCPAAELELRSIDAPGRVYRRLESIVIRTEVFNIGDLESTESALDYYASTDTIIDNTDHFLGRCEGVPAIPPSVGVTFGCPRSIPADLPYGDYHIGGILDYTDGNSSNQVAYDPTPITVVTEEVFEDGYEQ